MHPWIGKSVFLLGFVALILLRAPHENRSKATPVAESRIGALELTLLGGMTIGFLVLPLLSLTPLLAFAEHALPVSAFVIGILCRSMTASIGVEKTEWNCAVWRRRRIALGASRAIGSPVPPQGGGSHHRYHASATWGALPRAAGPVDGT